MEKKRNVLVLVSSIFGALFVVGAVIFWIFAMKTTNGVDLITELKNIISALKESGDTSIKIIILMTVIIPLSFIFNLIGWIKGNNKYILIAGILYIFCFNFISAPLCIIEYFDNKRKIKNKLLFYTMIYSFLLNALLIPFFMIAGSGYGSPVFEQNYKVMLPFWIYMISAITVGLIFNYIAWKKSNEKSKIIAGVFYIFGILTIISAVICFILGKDYMKAIKNKLLFYSMALALLLSIICIGGMILGTTLGGGVDDILPVLIYMIIAAVAGFVLNFVAWKTNNKKAKIIAGIIYILGVFNVISAILCFISCKDNRKLIGNEEKT